MENNQKAELVVTALQQRMGELVANYETQIAILRAEITILMQEKEQKEESINQYNQELASKISEVN
jgi:uncharacterized small protein (DUF1192 family)